MNVIDVEHKYQLTIIKNILREGYPVIRGNLSDEQWETVKRIAEIAATQLELESTLPQS